MSLRHTLLGLLSVRDMTGYSIKQLFDRAVYFVWQASDSQIYRELHTLRDEGFVESERVLQKTRPNKDVYTITERGEKELDEWLCRPLVEEPYKKDPFRVRLFFLGRAEPIDQLSVLLDRRDKLAEEMGLWRRRREEYSDLARSRHPELLEWQLELIDLTLGENAVELEWIDGKVTRILEKNPKLERTMEERLSAKETDTTPAS